MASWRPNSKQKQTIWAVLVLAVLIATAGFAWGGVVVLAAGAIAVWKFDSHGEKPENAAVKSVRCGGCGTIGEPHWKSCPRCGATKWEESG